MNLLPMILVAFMSVLLIVFVLLMVFAVQSYLWRRRCVDSPAGPAPEQQRLIGARADALRD